MGIHREAVAAREEYDIEYAALEARIEARQDMAVKKVLRNMLTKVHLRHKVATQTDASDKS